MSIHLCEFRDCLKHHQYHPITLWICPHTAHVQPLKRWVFFLGGICSQGPLATSWLSPLRLNTCNAKPQRFSVPPGWQHWIDILTLQLMFNDYTSTKVGYVDTGFKAQRTNVIWAEMKPFSWSCHKIHLFHRSCHIHNIMLYSIWKLINFNCKAQQ